jgi:hypothetical protein
MARRRIKRFPSRSTVQPCREDGGRCKWTHSHYNKVWPTPDPSIYEWRETRVCAKCERTRSKKVRPEVIVKLETGKLPWMKPAENIARDQERIKRIYAKYPDQIFPGGSER